MKAHFAFALSVLSCECSPAFVATSSGADSFGHWYDTITLSAGTGDRARLETVLTLAPLRCNVSGATVKRQLLEVFPLIGPPPL